MGFEESISGINRRSSATVGQFLSDGPASTAIGGFLAREHAKAAVYPVDTLKAFDLSSSTAK
jgi:hypothetical protein